MHQAVPSKMHRPRLDSSRMGRPHTKAMGCLPRIVKRTPGILVRLQVEKRYKQGESHDSWSVTIATLEALGQSEMRERGTDSIQQT